MRTALLAMPFRGNMPATCAMLTGGTANTLPSSALTLGTGFDSRLTTPSGVFWNCAPMILNFAPWVVIALMVVSGTVRATGALPASSELSGITSGPPDRYCMSTSWAL